MKVKTYTQAEALNAPREMNGLVQHGWLWRKPDSRTVAWIYTSSINLRTRSYPSNAEFIPVYVEVET